MKRTLTLLLVCTIVYGCHKELSPRPVAVFTFSPETCTAPCKVTFTNDSQNANSFEWDFDDGKGIKTGSGPIEYIFEDGKDYYVKLIAKSSDGSSHGITQKVAVDAKPASKPEAEFKVELDNDSIVPSTATFSNLSTNAKTYLWNFGDEENSNPLNPNTSKDQNPRHKYEKPGKYSVSLTSYNAENIASEPMVKVIEIKSIKPFANFAFPENDCSAPCEIAFTNKSTGAKTYNWDFGDDSPKSTEVSPKHIFKEAKSYTVTLTAYGDDGQSHVKKDTVVVKTPAAMAVSISSEYNFPFDIIADPSGNIYVCGATRGETKFGDDRSFTTGPNRKDDYFVAKYNSGGQMIWARVDGSSDSDAAYSIALDQDNNVLVTGSVRGAPRISAIFPQGEADVFVQKLNGSTGDSMWFTLFGGPADDVGTAIGFYQTPSGPRVYLGGTVTGDGRTPNINFSNGLITHAIGKDIFFVFLDAATGVVKQPTILRTAGSQNISSIVLDRDGNAYMTGSFEQTVNFEGKTSELNSIGESDSFVAKWVLNPGNFQWVKQIGSIGSDFGGQITIDEDQNIYVNGTHSDYIREAGATAGNDDWNVFVWKLNPSGEKQWINGGFGRGMDYSGGLTVRSGTKLIVSGSFSATGQYPSGDKNATSFISYGGADVILSEVESSDGLSTGHFDVRGGGEKDERVIDICTARDGSIYATGWFTGKAQFNGVTLENFTGLPRTYIVKYKP